MRNGQGGRGGGEVELAAALRARIAELVKDYRLQTDRKGEAPSTFNIIDGYLPPKRSNNASEWPLILVRPSSGKTANAGSSTVKLDVYICTYSEDYDGHNYALNALARIRAGLLQNQVLDNRYKLEFPLEWVLIDDQPYPQWQLILKTEWAIHTPIERVEL